VAGSASPCAVARRASTADSSRSGASLKIADLPFHEKPIRELLALHKHHTREEALQYAGYGWTRAPKLWLNEELVSNALIVAVHSDDHGKALPDDIELAFELSPDEGVTMVLSKFLDVWLPRLPMDGAIVLAVCNPFNATLKMPGASLRYPMGNAFAWIDDLTLDIGLEAETWCTLGS
jgi:hypothetical protein